MKVLSTSERPASVASAKSESSLRRRRDLRYPVAAEVTFRWSTRSSMLGEGNGQSRDVSQGGAFILARSLPPVGSAIDLTVQLPAWQVGAASLRMEMTGEVVRVELPPGHEGNWGFAVCSLKTVLRRLNDGELCAARTQ
jgi:hypothetical protein